MIKNKYLGFDSATVTGWAFRNRAGRWVNGTFAADNLLLELAAIIPTAKAEGITHAIIEDCYLGYGPKMNPATIKRLQEIQTRICVECERAGLKVSKIYPSTWQAAWRLSGKRDVLKAGAKKTAALLGAVCVKQDEADAVLIAEYGNCLVLPDTAKMQKG